MPDSLALTVNVSADEWDATRRRVVYLETLLIGVADHAGLDAEWYDVERLAGLWGGRRLEPPPATPSNVVPAWVLPLMRLQRGEAEGELAYAWTMLPEVLPAGVAMPGEQEAAAVLLLHGLT